MRQWCSFRVRKASFLILLIYMSPQKYYILSSLFPLDNLVMCEDSYLKSLDSAPLTSCFALRVSAPSEMCTPAAHPPPQTWLEFLHLPVVLPWMCLPLGCDNTTRGLPRSRRSGGPHAPGCECFLIAFTFWLCFSLAVTLGKV